MTSHRRLQALFLLSLLGVLVVLGLLVTAALGAVAGLAYAAVVLTLLCAGAWRARAVAAPPSGRTCTCCTTTPHGATVHDPASVLP